MPRLTLLLASRDGFDDQSVSEPLAMWLGRADRAADADAGRKPQLQRHFDILPRGIAEAPITRQLDAGDAQLHAWLRADPAYVQADMATGRMLACGELGLTPADCDALLQPLRPLFGDEGFPISAPVPQRWYLMLPKESKTPRFSTPDDVLGDDLHAHMPVGDAGRRWRRLLSEAQIILHNHPLNAQRIAAGKPPVNSLWFWGGGLLPDHVRVTNTIVYSDDVLVHGLTQLAGIDARPLSERFDTAMFADDVLVDLAGRRSLATLDQDWLQPAISVMRKQDQLQLDFGDGAVFTLQRSQRWRFWRPALARLSD
ncbi:MAG: phosphoglycerate mutase [Lysobacteraceae bacterium]